MEWLLLLVALAWLYRLQVRVRKLEARLSEKPVVPARARPGRPSGQPREVEPEAPVPESPLRPLEEAKPQPASWAETAARPPLQPAAAPAASQAFDERATAITSSVGASLQAWFRGGNAIVRIGLVILFIGVAFLLRFAAEHSMLPIELRLAGVAAAAVVLCVIGWRLRRSRPGYGLSLQGGGIGVLYLVVFAALRLYSLLPAAMAFPMLVALAAITASLAVLQDSLPLALLGFGGGFLAPVFASTGEGSHVALFSYFAVLNLAIAWIASRKAWKLLNLAGAAFTFGVGAAWGARSYEPSMFGTTEPFLLGHLALYLFVSVQYSRQLVQAGDEARLRPVDGGLLFGVPVAAFGLQAGLVRSLPYGLALSAAGLSAVYLLLGRWLVRQAGGRLRLLTEGLLALGLVFLILVTPLALDARWTGAAWSVQGAGLAWIALRQRRAWAVALGVLLQLAAAVSFWSVGREAGLPVALNPHLLGALMLGVSAFFTAGALARHGVSSGLPDRSDRGLHWTLLALGALQTFAGLWLELRVADWPSLELAWRAAMLAVALGALLEGLQSRLRWPELGVPARVFTVLAVMASLAGVADRANAVYERCFERWGWAEALAILAVGAWQQWRLDRDGQGPWRRSFAAEALLLAWYAALQGSLQAWALAGHFIAHHESWTALATLVPPVLLAWWIAGRLQGSAWPACAHASAWHRGLLLPCALMACLWCVAVDLFADGSMAPLPYLPLVNPVDLGHGLVALYAAKLWRGGRLSARALVVGAGGVGFWWASSLLVRSLHHWAGTPLWLHGALDSDVVQTGLTILWSAMALVAMLWATRRAQPSAARPVWVAGAVLLGVVVLKLFFVDLSSVGALERIVSFLGVGGLMLVIGYVSPLPPASRSTA